TVATEETCAGGIPGAHSYTRRHFKDVTGKIVGEYWLVHGVAHAWLGGDARGAYPEPNGPDAATVLIRLFADRARVDPYAPSVAVNVISVVRGGNWRESIGKYWPMAIWVVLGTMIGTHFLLVAPPELLQLLLAAMIVAFLLQDRIRRLDLTWIRRRPAVSGA